MRACTVERCDRPHVARGFCMKHYMRSRRAEPVHRRRENVRQLERHHQRAADEPDYRERLNAQDRKRRTDPERRERRNARRRTRLANDPEYRERLNARQNARARERRRTEPDYRERLNAQQRERYRRQGGRGYARWRRTLLMEQGFACALCGKTITAEIAHVDHIRPVSHGGGSEKANLQATCPTCNFRKGNRA